MIVCDLCKKYGTKAHKGSVRLGKFPYLADNEKPDRRDSHLQYTFVSKFDVCDSCLVVVEHALIKALDPLLPFHPRQD
jgi:hypothetical protein